MCIVHINTGANLAIFLVLGKYLSNYFKLLRFFKEIALILGLNTSCIPPPFLQTLTLASPTRPIL